MRTIKKYSNRRLYDTQNSKYINLSDIKKMILDNINFVVYESSTDKNITHQTLLMVMLEQESNVQSPIFTSKILEYLIKVNEDESLQPFLRKYIEESMAMFMENQDTVKDLLEQVMLYSPFYMLSNMNKNFFNAQGNEKEKEELGQIKINKKTKTKENNVSK